MKSRIARTILGVLCVLAAFWPGALAVSLYIQVIQPGFNAGPNTMTIMTISFGVFELRRGGIHALAIVSAVAAVTLFLGGLFLIFFWPREDAGRDPRAD